MKTALILAILAVSTVAASAQYGGYSYGTGSNSSDHYVNGHTTSRGTQVDGHYRTNPNNTQMDNFGSRGNYNYHNNSYGTHSPRY